MDELRSAPVLAVDLNAEHLAARVVSPYGNPTGPPITVSLELSGLAGTTRDGRLWAAISELIQAAKANGCRGLVIVDLGFAAARTEGREHTGPRPSRGRRGRRFRALVAGILTGRFRDRLVPMAANVGLWAPRWPRPTHPNGGPRTGWLPSKTSSPPRCRATMRRPW